MNKNYETFSNSNFINSTFENDDYYYDDDPIIHEFPTMNQNYYNLNPNIENNNKNNDNRSNTSSSTLFKDNGIFPTTDMYIDDSFTHNTLQNSFDNINTLREKSIIKK